MTVPPHVASYGSRISVKAVLVAEPARHKGHPPCTVADCQVLTVYIFSYHYHNYHIHTAESARRRGSGPGFSPPAHSFETSSSRASHLGSARAAV